ncbi:putative glycosyl transferase [compost metagenome]
MIRDTRCGFVVEPEDPSAFADALEQAASDKAALREMGARGHELAVHEFNRDLLADRFICWLEGVQS